MAEQIMMTPYQIDLWLKEKIDQLQAQVGSGDLSGVLDTISTIQTTLGNKVDKVVGKGLSTNDFTTTLKTKLDGIETGAEKNPDIATEAEAKAGTNNVKMMTALRVKQSITENASSSKIVLDGGKFSQGEIYWFDSIDYSLNKTYLINIIFYDEEAVDSKVHYQFMLTPNNHNIKATIAFLTFDNVLQTTNLDFQLASNKIEIQDSNFGYTITLFDRITIIEL